VIVLTNSPACRARAALAVMAAAMLAVASDARAEAPKPGGETAELPQRRPGYWRISTISPQLGMQTHEVCIEAGDSIIGSLGKGCDAPSVRSGGGEAIVTFACELGGARQVTSLLFTGDFTSWYRAQAKVTVTEGASATERSGFTIDAKFLAPDCPKAGGR
jgi:hypothetical protein